LARYRLRFLLQEFDLPQGETMIGRGPECRITIIDPLVSRNHARVLVAGAEATIEDLGSRNGSRVNDHMVVGKQPLCDGDRIRIGTQELVFSQVDAVAPSGERKATGFLCTCAQCHTPFPQEMQRCPNCGSAELESERVPGKGLDEEQGRQAWALQLLMEMLQKAMAMGRSDDAERILGQAVATVEERMKTKTPLEPVHIEALGAAAVGLSRMQGNGKWAKWVLELHERMAKIPPFEVADEIWKLPPEERRKLAPAVAALVKSAHDGIWSPAERERLQRFQTLSDALRGG
jgi:hypothetical protein